jgi:hypothetical protein
MGRALLSPPEPLVLKEEMMAFSSSNWRPLLRPGDVPPLRLP